MSNTFDKLSILGPFIEEVNSYLPEIEANLSRLTQSPDDMEALEETYRRTHTIGGSASMMDFPGLAHVAQGMEDILGDALDGLDALTPPAVALLKRSFGRMHYLLQGIREGVNEQTVIADDDADYMRFRAEVNALQASSTSENTVSNGQVANLPVAEVMPLADEMPVPSSMPSSFYSSMPSLDEVLASFRTPSVAEGEELSWPEEPVELETFSDDDESDLTIVGQHVQPEVQVASESTSAAPAPDALPTNTGPSALERLVASTRPTPDLPVLPEVPSAPTASPASEVLPEEKSEEAEKEETFVTAQAANAMEELQQLTQPVALVATDSFDASVDGPENLPAFTVADQVALPDVSVSQDALEKDTPFSEPPMPIFVPDRSLSAPTTPAMAAFVQDLSVAGLVLPRAFEGVQGDAQSLKVQASSLWHILDQLRMVISVVEMQRGEFKGFLDGSKDALDRMEDWAGQVMGLNLRNSPDEVRRYLPLSVMWVANAKLKKVLDLLTQITSGVEVTDQQIQQVLRHLYSSIASCGEAFQELQEQAEANASESELLAQAPGWSPWEVQVSREAEELRERVTFERRGDPAALRAEIEGQLRKELREELRREYEDRSLSLAARAELEQQIRNEVRREFAEKQQLQERLVGPEPAESLSEIEGRLRSEIEIQVRQEFLNQITSGTGEALNISMQQTLRPPAPSVPRTSNFLDQAREATGLASLEKPELPPSFSLPQQVAVQPMAPSTQPIASLPVFPPTPKQAPLQPSLSATAQPYSGDLSDEAAEIFHMEAEEHLQTISMHVAALEQDPTNRDILQGIRRATHTLKGAAGMMGFRAIASLSHISEDLLESVMEGSTSITPAVLSLILDTADTLDQLVSGKDSSPAKDDAKVIVLRERYKELLGEQSVAVMAEGADFDADDAELDDTVAQGGISGTQAHETNAQRAARGDMSIRVRLEKLDELVNLFGEMLVNRSILEERIERLVRLVTDVGVSSNRLRDVGQKLEGGFEAATLPSGRSVQAMPGTGDKSKGLFNASNGNKERLEPSHLADFDELELDRYTEFHQLARGLSEGISDMTTLSTEMDAVIRECEAVFGRENRLNTTFQDRLMKARLVPLSTMTPRLYRAARVVALKQGKVFDFLLEGQETEVDRTVNEEIAGPLLHLMRNAVNHALETPEVRIQKGKSPVGQIKLSASYEGNQVVITVRDDGMGIDPERIRNAAIARGLIGPDQALADENVIDLIFRPGFSTAEVLSEESGRGVGLDVVRDSVSRLRGSLEVESMPGQGTAFTMKFPTSLAIQSAMMVKASGQQFAIPTVIVDSIGRLDTFKQTMVAGRPAVVVQNDTYPLTILSQLVSLPVGTYDNKAPLLLVNANGHRVALVVDEIKGKMDVVMKNLGPHLRSVHGIAGGTVMGNGRVMLILELSELLSTRPKLMGIAMGGSSSYRDGSGASVRAKAPKPGAADMSNSQAMSAVRPPKATASMSERGKHILVVDDSPSVRRVVSNMLKQHGWEVQMARDGVEALEMISRETPAAVLLDIEMPRMDGYELTATVRAQAQYRTLPLIILTSRAAAKHQQRAIQLGVDAYVIKPYQDDELLKLLNTLIYGATVQ